MKRSMTRSLVIFDFGCTKTKQVIQSNDHITCFAS